MYFNDKTIIVYAALNYLNPKSRYYYFRHARECPKILHVCISPCNISWIGQGMKYRYALRCKHHSHQSDKVI